MHGLSEPAWVKENAAHLATKANVDIAELKREVAAMKLVVNNIAQAVAIILSRTPINSDLGGDR
jgi:hypothetical protein